MVAETQTLPQTSAIQEQCTPVGDEFGTPVSAELLADPEFSDVIDEMTTNLAAAHAVLAEDLENGVAAGRALKALGCTACELSNTCTVRDTLVEREAMGREGQELLDKATMIATAPTWLKAARFNKSGISTADMQEIMNDDEAAAQALENGVIDRMIGDVTNKHLDGLTKDELPEAANIGVVPAGKPLPTEEITTKNGQKFVVVDATSQNYPRDSITDESRAEYGVLCAKLVDRMNALDANGQPQILDQDHKMQKLIKNADSQAGIYEMRMTGKNRMYFSVVKSPDGPDGPIARMIILGAHGGDASTQRAFIDISLN